MIATVDNPSNAAEWALAEMVNRLVSLLSVLPQLKFWASYATEYNCPILSSTVVQKEQRARLYRKFSAQKEIRKEIILLHTERR